MEKLLPAIRTLLVLGAIQGVVLGIIGLTKSRKSSNILMAILLFIFSVSIATHSIGHLVFIPYIIKNHEFLIGLGLLNLGPIYYCYVKSVTRFNTDTRRSVVPFFTVGVFSVIAITVYSLSPIWVRKTTMIELIMILNFICGPSYLILSMKRLIIYSRRIKHNFSNIEKINLRWLKFLGSCLFLFLIASVIAPFISPNEYKGDIIWFCLSVIIFLIGYFNLAQPEVLADTIIVNPVDGGKDRKKYEKSVLTPEMAKKQAEKIQVYIQQEKPYLDGELTLAALARAAGLTPHHLSQIINESMGLNFYDFINSHRINEAKQRLEHSGNGKQNISSIAFDVGFNSLSAFNSAFKKFTGMTPSQYKKSKTVSQ